jgi:hypothetical protein
MFPFVPVAARLKARPFKALNLCSEFLGRDTRGLRSKARVDWRWAKSREQRLKARLIIRRAVCLKAYPDTNRDFLPHG